MKGLQESMDVAGPAACAPPMGHLADRLLRTIDAMRCEARARARRCANPDDSYWSASEGVPRRLTETPGDRLVRQCGAACGAVLNRRARSCNIAPRTPQAASLRTHVYPFQNRARPFRDDRRSARAEGRQQAGLEGHPRHERRRSECPRTRSGRRLACRIRPLCRSRRPLDAR